MQCFYSVSKLCLLFIYFRVQKLKKNFLVGQFDISSLDSLFGDGVSLCSERTQCVAVAVGGVRLQGNDPELCRPPSCVRRSNSRRRCPLPSQEKEELGVEPVLCPGGVHRR